MILYNYVSFEAGFKILETSTLGFSIILILLIVLYDLLFMNNNSFKEKLYNAFFFCTLDLSKQNRR